MKLSERLLGRGKGVLWACDLDIDFCQVQPLTHHLSSYIISLNAKTLINFEKNQGNFDGCRLVTSDSLPGFWRLSSMVMKT